jgi:hypothetical protein
LDVNTKDGKAELAKRLKNNKDAYTAGLGGEDRSKFNLGETLEADRVTIREARKGAAGFSGREEDETFRENQQRELVVAKARDKYLRENGRESEAVNEDLAQAKQTKELIERQSVGDLNLARSRVLQQLDRVKAAAPDSTEAKELERQLAMMQLAATGQHAEIGAATQGDVRKATGANQATSVGTDVKSTQERQAAWLSSVTGRNVTVQNLQNEFKRFVDVMGDQATAILEQAMMGLDKSAGQGAIGNAGLLAREYKDGKKKIRLTYSDPQKITDDEGHIKGRRMSGLSGSKITNLAGFSQGVDSDAGGNAIVNSEDSLKIATQLIAPLTANNSDKVDSFTIETYASILEHSDDTKVADLLQRMQDANKDKRALFSVLSRALEQMSNDPAAAANRAQVEAVIQTLV